MANIVKPSGINSLWAAGGTKTDPGSTKVNIGWVVELPPYQYANWLENRQDTFIAHMNQHGIPEWDVETEYQGNLSYTQGSNGLIYKCLATNIGFDPTNPNNSAFWVRAFEAYGSVQAVQDQLNAHLVNYATLSGITNLIAARNNLSVWSKAESDTRYAAFNGNSSAQFSVANATLSAHAVPLGQLNSLLVAATTTSPGVVQLATPTDVENGTDNSKVVTPFAQNAIVLKRSGNLAGLANVATARANLGLGTIATEAASAYLKSANNLSDIGNAGTARANLGITSTATQPETYFLRTANNLSDVNAATARSNLGLQSTAITPLSSLMLKSENLAGLTNVAAARGNLGLADTATIASGNFLWRGNNLADLTNAGAARNNLGLGSAATMNAFGTNGSLDFSASGGTNGYQRLPSGLTFQWGIGAAVGDGVVVNIVTNVPGQVIYATATPIGPPDTDRGPDILVNNFGYSTFQVNYNWARFSYPFTWFCITV